MRKNPAVGTIGAVPTRGGGVGDWPRWAPYAAVAWSLIYAGLGIYWLVSGGDFPYAVENTSEGLGPLLGQLGRTATWIVVITAGLPAAVLGILMLRGVRGRLIRPLFIVSGTLLTGVLLLLMTDLNLLILLGYIPNTLFRLLTDGDASFYMKEFAQAQVPHQLMCLLGGFLWLGATISYARRSGDACLVCGRRDTMQGWTSPDKAAHWGRIAVYVAMVAPIFYALTRYAWALGIPLGMSEEALRGGQERGTWISGLFLATFALVGALIMLGLVQRWGEVFPRWIPGLSGRKVPVALAVVPAAFVSVLLVVGGIVIWSGLGQMAANLAAAGVQGMGIFWGIFFQVGPTLLFPLWGVALAVATLGYYYRRRGPCRVCGRGDLPKSALQHARNIV